MKILILSYHFVPYAGMGALRVGGLANFLSRQGHEVRVIAARNSVEPMNMNEPLNESFAEVSYAKWLDVNFFPDQGSRFKNWILGDGRRLARLSTQQDANTLSSGGDHSVPNAPEFLSRLDRLYRLCLNIPDDKVGWLPFALWQGWRTMRSFKPDVIFASSPPATGLIAAAWLARSLSVPWVAEFRDRWADDPYDPRPPWRAALDRRLERRVLSTASGIVTVSETWAQAYRERYDKPTAVIYNGFIPEDYEHQPLETPSGERQSLHIVYTGAVYAGRDPTPLWQALKLMGQAADWIQVEFYGSAGATILEDAAEHGVSECVRLRDVLPHDDALRLQCQADVLLLLQWNNPSEAGNIPGKLFEYLGARRPILALGYKDGEMAQIVRDRKAGLFSNDPEEIARQLAAWCDEKRKAGHIAPPLETAPAGFSRDEQFGELVRFLQKTVSFNEGPAKGDGG